MFLFQVALGEFVLKLEGNDATLLCAESSWTNPWTEILSLASLYLHGRHHASPHFCFSRITSSIMLHLHFHSLPHFHKIYQTHNHQITHYQLTNYFKTWNTSQEIRERGCRRYRALALKIPLFFVVEES